MEEVRDLVDACGGPCLQEQVRTIDRDGPGLFSLRLRQNLLGAGFAYQAVRGATQTEDRNPDVPNVPQDVAAQHLMQTIGQNPRGHLVDSFPDLTDQSARGIRANQESP